MELKILSLELENFKGIKHGIYVFDSLDATIKGSNGVGKTTLNSAWLWLLGNVDVTGKTNPAIFPLNVEECKPSVIANILIGEQPIKLFKSQTRRVSKPDVNGVCRESYTNNYAINDCEKSERDFKAYLSELGLDFDYFLPLSHPDIFISEKKDEQREVLTKMADAALSDKEVALMLSGTEEVVKRLEHYTLDEIENMAKASLRKIAMEYGKEGEILKAKIEGLELAKVELPLAEIELGLADAKRKAADIQKKLDDESELVKSREEISNQYMKAKFDLGDLARKYTEQSGVQIRANRAKYDELNNSHRVKTNDIARYQNLIDSTERLNSDYVEQIERCRIQYREIMAEKFDEASTFCPTCNQLLPPPKIATIQNDFEASKKNRLADVTARGNDLRKKIDSNRTLIDSYQEQLKVEHEGLADLERQIAEYKALIEAPMEVIDYTVKDDYRALQSVVDGLAEKLSSFNVAEEVVSGLRSELANANNEIAEYKAKLAQNENNTSIDNHIAELREMQSRYEQDKADNEQIIDLVALIVRKRNEIATESINKHFKIVKWQLGSFLKNGTFQPDCIPLVNGKPLVSHCNTGLQILAKIDIIAGLQKFYGMSLPLFVDGVESLDTASRDALDTPMQTILLTVTDDKNLEVCV